MAQNIDGDVEGGVAADYTHHLRGSKPAAIEALAKRVEALSGGRRTVRPANPALFAPYVTFTREPALMVVVCGADRPRVQVNELQEDDTLYYIPAGSREPSMGLKLVKVPRHA